MKKTLLTIGVVLIFFGVAGFVVYRFIAPKQLSQQNEAQIVHGPNQGTTNAPPVLKIKMLL
jgi:hypothetical protein